MHAEGERNEQPLTLRKIRFHVMIQSPDATDADMQQVLHQAELISPVWLAIKGRNSRCAISKQSVTSSMTL